MLGRVVTRILLRLIPLPSERVDLLVPFEDFAAAAESVSEIIRRRIVPAALEFVGKDSILAVEKLTEKEVPLHEAADRVYEIAVSLGGMITGEHGIGVTRKGVLSLGADEAQIEIMKGIKTAFDPHGILNPGKILS